MEFVFIKTESLAFIQNHYRPYEAVGIRAHNLNELKTPLFYTDLSMPIEVH